MIAAILGVLTGLAIGKWLIVPRYRYHEPRALRLALQSLRPYSRGRRSRDRTT